MLATRVLERDRGIGLAQGADVLGALLVTSALMLGVYTIVEAADAGWGSGRTLVLGAISLSLLAGFIFREARTQNPLMPLRIFRSRNVTGANLVQILMVAGLFGIFFLGALYLQRCSVLAGRGRPRLPPRLGADRRVSLRVSPPLIDRFGPKAVLLPGCSSSPAAWRCSPACRSEATTSSTCCRR